MPEPTDPMNPDMSQPPQQDAVESTEPIQRGAAEAPVQQAQQPAEEPAVKTSSAAQPAEAATPQSAYEQQPAQQNANQPQEPHAQQAQAGYAQQPYAQQPQAQQPYGQPQPQAYAQPQQPYGQAQAQNTPGDTAPLVLGILSIVFASVVGLVLGIIGLMQSKKVLAVNPNSGKAKGGRICSIIGIVLSVIATAAVIAVFVLGISILGGDGAQASVAATSAVESAIHPDSATRAADMDEIDTAYKKNTSLSLSDMGISKDDYAKWLFDSATSSVGNVRVDSKNNKTTATVTINVKRHSVSEMEDIAKKKFAALDTSKLNITTMSEYAKEVGGVYREAMNETPLSSKAIDVTVTKTGNTWKANESTEDLFDEVFSD